MSLVSFLCGLNALLFLYLAWSFSCKSREHCEHNLRLIFMGIMLISLFIALGTVLFEYEYLILDSALPVATAVLVDDRQIAPLHLLLLLGGLLMLFLLKNMHLIVRPKFPRL